MFYEGVLGECVDDLERGHRCVLIKVTVTVLEIAEGY